MKNKFVCVHGHFYQPPRENPWLDATEPEESARPYRTWNDRIFEECYGPNAATPLRTASDKGIEALVCNYDKMSFDFGPTLLSWLEAERPEFYRELVDSDKRSAALRDGHGNALAHPFIHAILPLQTLSDKRRLVRWGLQDFERRFGRKAEGFWLPETGVDEETLEVLVEHGIRFTILRPTQAARVRELGAGEDGWKPATHVKLPPTRPYRWLSRAQEGKGLALFFYHDKLSQGVVSGETLEGEEGFARKIVARFLPDESTQLVSVASDGEFYGHHHRHGAAALAAMLAQVEAAGFSVVNYAQFLDLVPPPQEVEIVPRTAWSCDHGLGRWTEDCGCRIDGSTSQKWRGPMRAALDGLSRQLERVFEANAGRYFRDFRDARERYAERLSDPADASGDRFLARHARFELRPEEKVEALSLMELERHRLSMFTSCGWFFDDISGLEAAQCLSHAARAGELAARFEKGLEEVLSDAKVLARAVDLERAAAHFALCLHIDGFWPNAYGFDVFVSRRERRDKLGLAGRDRSLSFCALSVGRRATGERRELEAVVYQRDRVDFACWLAEPGSGAFDALAARFAGLDDEAFLAAATRKLGAPRHTLEAMLSEERRNAMRLLMPGPGDSHERKELLSRWRAAVAKLGVPGEPSDETLELLPRAKALGLNVQQLPWVSRLSEELVRAFEAAVDGAWKGGASPAALSRAARWTSACEAQGLAVSLWRLQHLFWRWREALLSRGGSDAERDAAAALGEKLGFADSALPLPTRAS